MIAIESKVCEIIRLAKDCQKVKAVDHGFLCIFEPDSAEQMLRNYINKLTPDERSQIIAVMLIGRGDVDGSWEQLVNSANRLDSEYLLSKDRLVEYLEQGLIKNPGWRNTSLSRVEDIKEDTRHEYRATLQARYTDGTGHECIIEKDVQVLAENEDEVYELLHVYPHAELNQEDWDINSVELIEN